MADIIKCKDCKHLKGWRTPEQAEQFGQEYECGLEVLLCPSPDDYCSKAERKEESKTGHCKDCKYFEYDSVGKVDGMPLIVAHEVCTKWGEGCKTEEDGFCFMYAPKDAGSEDK